MRASRQAKDSAFRQAWREWSGSQTPEEFQRVRALFASPYSAPLSAIHPVKR